MGPSGSVLSLSSSLQRISPVFSSFPSIVRIYDGLTFLPQALTLFPSHPSSSLLWRHNEEGHTPPTAVSPLCVILLSIRHDVAHFVVVEKGMRRFTPPFPCALRQTLTFCRLVFVAHARTHTRALLLLLEHDGRDNVYRMRTRAGLGGTFSYPAHHTHTPPPSSCVT